MLIALSLASAPSALGVREDLTAGKDALGQGQSRLLAGDLPGARESFAQARADFRRAATGAGGPFLKALGAAPVIGRTPDALVLLSRAGLSIAEAGSSVTGGLLKLPDGLGSLAPKGGRIPLERLRDLAPAVSAARARLEEAHRLVRGVATSMVLPQVHAATAEVAGRLDRALRYGRTADEMLKVLPALAGAERPTRYLVALQNPTELRGTDGFIGLFAPLTFRDGAIDLAPFEGIGSLPDVPPAQAPTAPPGYEDAFGSFGGTGYWRNINVGPDVPTTAVFIEKLWAIVRHQRLDGVIFVDPQALPALMQVTGQVSVPGLAKPLSPDGVVDFVVNRAYFRFARDQAARKRALAAVPQAILGRFLQQGGSPSALQHLVGAAADGYIQMHSADPSVQRALRQVGVAGGFGAGGDDLFGLIVNNAGGNKVDYYVRRSVTYEVALGPGGTSTARAEATFQNTAPPEHAPNEALGPYRGNLASLHLVAGEAYSILSFACGQGCSARAERDGVEQPLRSYPQTDSQMFAATMRLVPQALTRFNLSFATAGAWRGDDAGGTYRIRLRGQAAIPPSTVSLVVHAPPGMAFASATPGVTVNGPDATWRGTLDRPATLELRFERPPIGRLWTRIWNFLRKPV